MKYTGTIILSVVGYECCSACYWPLRRNPLVTEEQVPNNVHTEHVEVVTKEDVEKKQLTDGVDAVQELDEDEGTCQIVSVELTRHADAVTRQQLTNTCHTSSPMVTSSHQISVQQVNSVPSNTTPRDCVSHTVLATF